MSENSHWYNSPTAQKVLEISAQAAGSILMVGAATFGLPLGIIGAFVATTAQVAHQRMSINKSEQGLLNFYRDKLSVLMHKPAASLTRDDLYKAAAPTAEGGLGITTLQKQIKNTERFKRIKTYGQIAAAALTAGLLIGTASISTVPLAAMGLPALIAITAISTLINNVMNAVTDGVIAKHVEKTATSQIYGIAAQVRETEISPTRVMDVFVRANPDLQKSIALRYGSEYASLTALQKSQVVKDSEATLHIAALTDEINKGTIKPNTLGFLAYGQGMDSLVDCQRYKTLCDTPAQVPAKQNNAAEPANSNHLDKLRIQRQGTPFTTQTLH